MDHEVELPGGSKRIMDEKSLPKGWKRVHDGSGRYYYLTRQPQVKITKKFQLESYHKAGRYKEMRLDRLDFGIKQRRKNFSVARVEAEEYGTEMVEEPIVCMETVAEEVFANVALRVCVVGDGHKFCTIEMLTLVRVHRFCSNMAHFKDMDTHISDPF